MSDEIIIIRDPVTEVVIEHIEQDIEISDPGPQGPTGPQGPAGAPGGASFEFEQLTPLTQWNINHGLNKRPHVTLVGLDGVEYLAHVHYVDLNNVSVVHNQPVAGRAELS